MIEDSGIPAADVMIRVRIQPGSGGDLHGIPWDPPRTSRTGHG